MNDSQKQKNTAVKTIIPLHFQNVCTPKMVADVTTSKAAPTCLGENYLQIVLDSFFCSRNRVKRPPRAIQPWTYRVQSARNFNAAYLQPEGGKQREPPLFYIRYHTRQYT